MENPDVSYLVTLYNKAVYLPHVLAGLAAQQGDFSREFIFVDDGSTDDTLAALNNITRGWPTEWQVQIISQSNAGPARAFNAGLALCRGTWLKPLDGDDVLMPHATQALIDAAKSCNVQVAFSPMHMQGNYDENTPLHFAENNDDGSIAQPIDMLPKTLKNAQTNPSVWLADCKLVQVFGGANPGVFIQDYSIELELGLSGKWAILNLPIVLFPRQLAARLSGNVTQTLHDVNLALLLFVRKHGQNLNRKIINISMARAASRAIKWQRRANKRQSLHLWLQYLLCRLGCARLDENFIAAVCQPFRKNNNLRIFYNQ